MDIVRKLIIAGTLSMNQHLSLPHKAEVDRFAPSSGESVTEAGEAQGDGWAEAAYEALKRAQHLCAILLTRLEAAGKPRYVIFASRLDTAGNLTDAAAWVSRPVEPLEAPTFKP
jgi:hypothetical protein